MRTYGRTRNVLTGAKTWWIVTTDINGFNDAVYLTALAQVCKLNLGESPFFGTWGIPARQSVVTQLYPNYYMLQIQQQFSGYFASLILTPITDAVDQDGRPSPAYNISILTNYGSRIGVQTAPGYPEEQPI
jgi:hypothetical protein